MKTKIKLILTVLALFFKGNLITAQECGIELLPEQIQYMNDTRDDRANTNISLFSNDDEKVILQIAVHIVRDNNGKKGLSMENLKLSIEDLNHTFEPANFKFHICSVDYIDNDEYANGAISQGFNNGAKEYKMALPHLVADAIDVFFVPVLYKPGINGWASFPSYVRDYGKDWIVLTNKAANNGSTLAHELGHYFSLYHTHQGSHDIVGWGDELVDGSNCGPGVADEICDTPADPTGLVYDDQGNKYHIGFCTNYSACTFRDDYAQPPCTFRDSNGDMYKPDNQNVMSYNYSHCRVNFSPQQIIRMQTSYEYERDYLSKYCELTCDNMFTVYDWLEKVACTNGSSVDITAYKYNEVWNYLDVKSGNERKLYLSNGDLECTDSNVELCIEELGLTEIIAACNITCPENCTDVNACNFGESENCIYECCQTIYDQFTWLKTDSFCKSIKVYDYFKSYTFIEVENQNNEKILYFEDGNIYCSGDGYEICKGYYKFDQILASCDCGNIYPILGCTDPNACNFNVNAAEDDGTCNYDKCGGCTDSGACNFDNNARINDESCIYPNTPCDDGNALTTNDKYNNNCICKGEEIGDSTQNLCEEIFSHYNWIERLVSCNNEKITIYEHEGWEFIKIRAENESILYLSDGQDRYLEVCDETYEFGEALNECICSSTKCDDPNACNFGDNANCTFGNNNVECANPCDESTCPDCERYTGKIFYTDCGGTTFRFIETEDGQIFDPYFNLVDLPIYDGQLVKFDFIDNNEAVTPCDIAEKAITITCIEEIDMIVDCNDVFSLSPIASAKVDQNNCTGESITIYSYLETYQYTYIITNEGGELFDGTTLWARDDGDYRLAQYYGFTKTAEWTCGCELSNNSAKSNLQTIESLKTTGLMESPTFKLYPNPAKQEINLELNKNAALTNELKTVSIFNLNGKVQQQHTFTGKQTRLNISKLPKGMYMITIQDGYNTISTQKLLVE